MNHDTIIGTDFTEGKMMPLVLRFMLPFLLANLLNSVYNTVDTIIIGQFAGSAGTLAVSLGGRLMNLCTMVSTSIAGGGQVLVSQLYGAKKREELNASIGTLLSLMVISSVGIAVLGFFLAGPILAWMNTPEEAFAAARAYFRITCVGLPLMFGYNAVSSVLRGMGDSKSPLLFIAIAAAINLVGDLIFVVAFELGAAGTAYATVIGQGVSLLFSLFLLYRRKERFGFDFRPESFRIDREKMAVMLRIGLPMVLRSCCIQFTQMFLMKFVNLYGVAEATTYAIGTKITQLTNIFSMSVRQAAGTIVGQNIGAGQQKRVGSALHCSLILTLSAAAVLSALSLLFPEVLFRCFTRDPAVLAQAETFVRIVCTIYVCSALLGPYDSVVTGTGNSLLGFLGGFLDGVVFRLGLGFLFAWGLDMGVAGFFLGDALARVAPIIIGMVYYHSGIWKRYQILK
ncbi:MAG: MATE family efflux transporter [Oscillospiraceae bacterium]